MAKLDLLLVGGGLSSVLLAIAFRSYRPNASVLLVEAKKNLLGNQTWSFHNQDLALRSINPDWIMPLVNRTWPEYNVTFPNYERNLQLTYHSIRASSLRAHFQKLGIPHLLESKVTQISGTSATLSDGKCIDAHLVIDGRGYQQTDSFKGGYQKFYGQWLKTTQPHNLKAPILMDANVSQADGFHFMYVLPWDQQLLLLEDTYYTLSKELDTNRSRKVIGEYQKQHGWNDADLIEEESGTLPIPFSIKRPSHPSGGLRGALFHPTTGYSFPFAAHMAQWLAENKKIGNLTENIWLAKQNRALTTQHLFYRLNRAWFQLSPPHERYKFIEHFYKLPESVISSFYSGQFGWKARIQLFARKPPVPIVAGLKSFMQPIEEGFYAS